MYALEVFDSLKYRVEVCEDGTYQYLNTIGMLHCEGVPAVVHPCGTKFWLQHDLLHREDGPAVERANGYKEWYLYGVSYPEAVYLAKITAIKSKNEH